MWILISILNVVFAYFAEKNYDNNKFLCKIFLFLIVLANVVIFGLRDFGVGTDTLVYVETYFNRASSLPASDLLFSENFGYDKGYLFLAYLSSSLSDDARLLLFTTELHIVVFLVLGLYNLKKTLNISITWFILFFVLLYQQKSINLMRQFCAISLLFYGYSFFLQNKRIAYLLFQVIAFSFHTSSILFVFIPFIQILSKTNGRFKYYCLIGISVVFVFFILYYYSILPYLSYFGVRDVYSDRYGAYSSFEGRSISVTVIVPFVLEMLIAYLVIKHKKTSGEIQYMFLSICVLNFLLALTNLLNHELHRLGFYYGIIMIAYFSYIAKYGTKILNMLCWMCAFAFLITTVRFFYINYYGTDNYKKNENNLIYKSEILGIDEN